MTSSVANPMESAVKGWAVYGSSEEFKLFEFKRRALKANDVLIRIHFCGICHTDIHEVQNEWNESVYPIVPGHEITGFVEQVGCNVKHFEIGDPVGVGCMVDSCRICTPCQFTYILSFSSFQWFYYFQVKWVSNNIALPV